MWIAAERVAPPTQRGRNSVIAPSCTRLHPLRDAAQRGRNSTHRTPLHPSDRVAQRRATPECKSIAPLPLLGHRQFGQPLLGLPKRLMLAVIEQPEWARELLAGLGTSGATRDAAADHGG